jgi:hypothetical protein
MARIHASQLDPNGDYEITGSLSVDGQTALTQTDPTASALLVSGAIEVVQAQIDQAVQRATVKIENLGAISDPGEESTIDLGSFF